MNQIYLEKYLTNACINVYNKPTEEYIIKDSNEAQAQKAKKF